MGGGVLQCHTGHATIAPTCPFPFTVVDRCEGPSMFPDTENKLGTELAVEVPSPGP